MSVHDIACYGMACNSKYVNKIHRFRSNDQVPYFSWTSDSLTYWGMVMYISVNGSLSFTIRTNANVLSIGLGMKISTLSISHLNLKKMHWKCLPMIISDNLSRYRCTELRFKAPPRTDGLHTWSPLASIWHKKPELCYKQEQGWLQSWTYFVRSVFDMNETSHRPDAI